LNSVICQICNDHLIFFTIIQCQINKSSEGTRFCTPLSKTVRKLVVLKCCGCQCHIQIIVLNQRTANHEVFETHHHPSPYYQTVSVKFKILNTMQIAISYMKISLLVCCYSSDELKLSISTTCSTNNMRVLEVFIKYY